MPFSIRLRMLRVLLAIDAVVLLAIGALLVAFPGKIGMAFGFRDLPPAASYLIGLWGCALISLGVGYVHATGDPTRNVAWVSAGIVRGALECVFGILVIRQNLVTWHQAAFGTIVAGVIAVGYIFLYPETEVRQS